MPAVGQTMPVDWFPIITTTIGAGIAIAGTLVADLRRGREDRRRERDTTDRQVNLAFSLALDAAHGGLRDIPTEIDEPASPAALHRLAAHAIRDSQIHQAREQLLATSAPEVVAAGETAFQSLIQIRDVIRAGAALRSVEYHSAYHRFAEALWAYRQAVRTSSGRAALVPQRTGRVSWSERESCLICGEVEPSAP